MKKLISALDHIAIAVTERDLVIKRFVSEMGAGIAASGRRSGSMIDQLKFNRGTKLEILSPDLAHKLGCRIINFLEKYGSSVHHVTLSVESVSEAVLILEAHGIVTVGNSLDGERYHEAYISPKDSCGLLVQLSWKDVDDEGWALRHGHLATMPTNKAADFLGLRVPVQDPIRAANVWTIFGGVVKGSSLGTIVHWPGNSLAIEFTLSAMGSEQALIFAGDENFIASRECGPQIIGLGRKEM